jgi:arsenate reductase (thioredoxin)
MAEATLNHKGRPNFDAYSAGSHPSGLVRPEALKQLEIAGLPTAGLRSKHWDEFAKRGAPKMDFVFTVCDNAAEEICPIWPGQPMTAHWGVPDPASVAGTPEQIERAFLEAFMILDRRISLLLSLPLVASPSSRSRRKSTTLDINEIESARAYRGGVFRYGLSRFGSGRAGHHGRAPVGWECSSDASC